MDTKAQPALDRVYEDFEPYYEWDRDDGRFIFMLPGYRRDQLKVQVTSKPALKLKGERQITPNRWRRFDLEFPIPSDYDVQNVSAKFEFEGSKLHVKFAKLVKPKETTKNHPLQEASSRPKKPSQNASNHQKNDAPKAKEDKKAETRTNDDGVSDQKMPQSDEKEKNKREATNNGITETIESSTTTKDDKPITRFKTRLLDFTFSLGPSHKVYNEEHGNMDAGTNKRKKVVTCGVLTLLVLGLGVYAARNALTSSSEGSKFQE